MDNFSFGDLTKLLKPEYVIVGLLVYIAFLKPVAPCVCTGGSK
jgi:hypothetical protein